MKVLNSVLNKLKRKHVVKMHSGREEYMKMLELKEKLKKYVNPKVTITDFYVGKKALTKKECDKLT